MTNSGSLNDEPNLRVGVVGVGLLGAGLLQLLWDKIEGIDLLCFEPNQSHIDLFQESDIPAKFCRELRELQDCDFVFVSAPPAYVCEIVGELIKLPKSSSIVVDLASTKSQIVDCILQGGGDTSRYFGGHPLAGGNTVGPKEASRDTLLKATFVITPHEGASQEALAKLRSLLEKLDFTVVSLDPQSHDEILALTSHLPHLISYAYVNALKSASGAIDLKDVERFASRSTQGVSEFASENAEMWAQIFQGNEHLSKWVDSFVLELLKLRARCQGATDGKLADMLMKTSDIRQSLLKETNDGK